VERRAVIIVGSGPAGAATALRLARRDPGLAGDVVLLEKSRHPRDKVCAGGVIPKSDRVLAELGLVADVPSVQVDHAGVIVPSARVTVDEPRLCRVVRRREFDATLAWAARDRGVALHEDTRVVAIARDGDGIRVETNRRTYWAPVVVGADGSGSLVRRALVPGDGGVVGRAVMCDVPVRDTAWDGFAARRYEFDFAPCTDGLRGYRWSFPCLIDGEPHVNAGAYALPPITGTRLRHELAAELVRVGARRDAWQAFPIRTWAPGTTVCAPRVLLAGDAAGCDPLMGEGISFALEYGVMAADAILRARATQRWDFADYAAAVAQGPMGRKLRLLDRAARWFDGPRARFWFGVARASRRAQRVGLAWYNGVDGFDERGVLGLMAGMLRPPRAEAA
jgi:flavin-dependent dehydrogenase